MIKRMAFASALLVSGLAFAQDVAMPEPVAPAAKAGEPEIALDADTDIDLANVVTSAAKGVTTVQEAPSIITIITSEDIKSRGFRFLEDALTTVPGWLPTSAIGGQVFNPLIRGVQQAVLLLRDGVTMFDPFGNIAGLGRQVPLENVKRIEIVTGPGGVLWGANSFLGVMNVISKDADDLNGFEVSAGYGDGPGNKQHFKAYGMFGKSFWKGKFKMFQHVSYETWIGSVYNIPQFVASSPAPAPSGPAFYGKENGQDPFSRSWMVTLDGKYTLGPITLAFNIPIGELHPQLIFANAVVPAQRFTILDRYAFLEYKGRFWKDRFGLQVKGYWSQFVRDFGIQLFPGSALFPPFAEPGGRRNPGGLQFGVNTNSLIQRTGGTVDMDLNLKYGIRLLFGGELFYESIGGSASTFTSPEFASGLPLVCPQMPNGDGTGFVPIARCPRQYMIGTSRVVGAIYVNAQYKPLQKLTLDGGVRIQKGFGERPYDLTPLYSAAAVWNFLPDFHLKATYATGFRAPVFNAISTASGGVAYGANPNLKNESSQSFQGEVNARLLRNVRKVRELELRVDYSYSFLDQIIQINSGIYGNKGRRAIHSVEGYAKLYLNGDHVLQASYTFLHATTQDTGVQRNVPNHWVSLGASFNVVKNVFDLNANLLVTGAYQDPNRYPSGPSPIPGCGGGVTAPACAEPATQARTSDLTWDRLTPIANLQLGFRLRFLKEKLGVTGQFYNVLNQRYWYPDGFYDLTPSIEMTPTPAPGFSFFASVSYRP